jgi:hypothetical protein
MLAVLCPDRTFIILLVVVLVGANVLMALDRYVLDVRYLLTTYRISDDSPQELRNLCRSELVRLRYDSIGVENWRSDCRQTL